jgi:hypothetical protein
MKQEILKAVEQTSKTMIAPVGAEHHGRMWRRQR